MNNKGFAVSGIVYGILIIFLLLVFSVLGILVTRKISLDKIRDNALSTVLDKGNEEEIFSSPLITDYDTMYVTSDASKYSSDYLKLGAISPYSVTVSSTFVTGHIGTMYNITYTAKDGATVMASSTKRITEVSSPKVYDFDFTGDKKSMVLSPGIYKFEVWGSSGGDDYNGTSYGVGGKGGYSVGYLVLTSRENVYVYVGGQGTSSAKVKSGTFPGVYTPGGFNGGGKTLANAGSGGGATDIRIGHDSLYARAIVAGAGGGAQGYVEVTRNGGAGGGTAGIKGDYNEVGGKGATLTSGGSAYNTSGTAGTFGQGGDMLVNDKYGYGSGAGGGGWFGGGTGDNIQTAGGGGSGYVWCSTYATPTYISSSVIGGEWLLNSNTYLTDYALKDGTTSFTSPAGSAEVGHLGNGFARISALVYYE